MEGRCHVFVSHSSVDEEFAQALTRTLTESGLLPDSDVFCTSVEGFGVPPGVDFIDTIRDELHQATVALPLITPAYLDSRFCGWELGALWAAGKRTIPVRLGNVSVGDLPTLLSHEQVYPFGKPWLEHICSVVRQQLGHPVNTLRWEEKRDTFLADYPALLNRLKANWATTPTADLGRQALAGRSLKKLDLVMERVLDTGWWAVVRPSSVKLFTTALRETARAIQALFSETSGGDVRVSLKRVLEPDSPEKAELLVEDWARDRPEDRRRGQDRIIDNTDFRLIAIERQPYFWDNHLSESVAAGRHQDSHRAAGTKYESAIVWPIRKLCDDEDEVALLKASGMADLEQDLVAFLCVDSPKVDAFSDYDVQLGIAIADALYTPLSLHRSLVPQRS